jgi:hypothetical protein
LAFLVIDAGMLSVPVALLDLLGSAFLGFPFQFLRVLTFAVTHFCSLLLAIDFSVQVLDAEAFRTWQKMGQVLQDPGHFAQPGSFDHVMGPIPPLFSFDQSRFS